MFTRRPSTAFAARRRVTVGHEFGQPVLDVAALRAAIVDLRAKWDGLAARYAARQWHGHHTETVNAFYKDWDKFKAWAATAEDQWTWHEAEVVRQVDDYTILYDTRKDEFAFLDALEHPAPQPPAPPPDKPVPTTQPSIVDYAVQETTATAKKWLPVAFGVLVVGTAALALGVTKPELFLGARS